MKENRKRRRETTDIDDIIVFREDRTIYFYDEVDSASVCIAIRFLDSIEKESSKKDITIKLNSDGGYCYDGLALYDRIRQSPCNIILEGSGLIASMGLIIFLAGDERRVSENVRLLNHQMSIEDFSGRNSEFKIEAKEMDTLDVIMTEIISERTGVPIKKLNSEILPGNKWFGAEFAVENGYADDIIKNIRRRRRKK